jgi:hypothetical protein
LGTSSLQSHGSGPYTKCFLHLSLSLSFVQVLCVSTQLPIMLDRLWWPRRARPTMYPAHFHYINNFGEWLWCAMNKMGIYMEQHENVIWTRTLWEHHRNVWEHNVLPWKFKEHNLHV